MEIKVVNESAIYPFIKRTFSGVRSSTRVQDLHERIVKFLGLDKIDGIKIVYEYKYQNDGLGGTFDVDIAVFGPDGSFEVAILAKAMNSSINKNVNNYSSLKFGEVSRLLLGDNPNKPKKILFFDLSPRHAPLFNKNGIIKSIETVKHKNSYVRDGLLKENKPVIIIDVLYDISNLGDYENKSQLENGIEFENLEVVV